MKSRWEEAGDNVKAVVGSLATYLGIAPAAVTAFHSHSIDGILDLATFAAKRTSTAVVDNVEVALTRYFVDREVMTVSDEVELNVCMGKLQFLGRRALALIAHSELDDEDRVIIRDEITEAAKTLDLIVLSVTDDHNLNQELENLGDAS